MKRYKFSTKLLSSLVHTEETNSNIANIFREKIHTKTGIHEVPAIHGNSIRGLLRNLGAIHLLETIEGDNLPTNIFHALFSGGTLEKSEKIINIERKKKIREMLPFLSIFGSALGNEMLQGKLVVSSAYPQCLQLETGITDIYDMVSIVRYTRQDDEKQRIGEKYTKDNEEKHQMFYDIEVLNMGVVLDWEILLDSDNEIEIACLNRVLQELENKPYLGGGSRAGHGKIEFNIKKESDLYDSYLIECKKEIKEFLLELI